ncbi:MAG TPA: hypothetical protein VHJ34_08870 [Actinomycetota bacterium]|nr:hypothetical protein [Actinomycetota bacterium]
MCEPVEDAHEALLESEDTAGLQAAVTRLNEAEAELVDAIGRLEPPDGAGEHFARYVDALERYTSAASDASAGSGDARARLTAAVEAARAGVGLEDAAATADVPDECPPPPGVDAHNTLFAARANLACFDIGTEMRAAGPFDAPATAREVVTALELGERVTAGIAAAVRSAATRQVDGLPVDDIIETSRRRFMALATLRTTFEKGNYAAYRAANRELRTVTAEADRLLLSVGLLECSKALGSLPL